MPKSLPAAAAETLRLVESAVISNSSDRDFKAGMCACIAQPRSGLAPMIPTRIVCDPFLRMAMTASDATDYCATLLCHDILLLLFTFTSPGWYSCRNSILATSISSRSEEHTSEL